jgi:tetratricopeptide (TPR) repeat protein
MSNARQLLSAEHAKLLFQQALNMHQRGNLEEAENRYKAVLGAYPAHPDCIHFLGILRFQQGRNDEALEHISAALKLQPSNTAALANYALVLVKLGRLEEALASYDKALAIEPDFVDALMNRGNILFELKRLEEALASYNKALAIKPNHVDALRNRAIILAKLKRLDEALESYDKVLAIKPDYVDALVNRGSVFAKLKRLDEALASYNRALAIRPGYPDALSDRGWLALLQGRYAEGWRDYENRREVKRLPAQWPKWKGEDLREKRIIVYEEQGLGDVIQCCRFLTLLAARGAEVTFLVRTSLHRLLAPFEPAVRLVEKLPIGEIFDFQSALMSLPGGLNITLESISADIPYLYPEEPLVALWRDRLGSQGFKVGICWQGKPDYKDEPGRSVPLSCFRPLASIPGVRLISLQKHHGLDQLENLPSDMRVETFGQDFDESSDAFVDTAAMMASLDLVITSDTSVAHLAGALGRPVWVALQHVPHWLWMLDRRDSPWYPTMTLYRQEVRDDWATVFRAIADDLAKLQEPEKRAIGHVLIPASVGELFDRITILTIKVEQIKDPDRLHNVNHELGLLRSVEATCGPLSPDVLGLVGELQSLNERLWAVEDELRACERRQAFGEEFVRLARAVYGTNDQRAAIKKRINMLCGSQIIDEKSY